MFRKIMVFLMLFFMTGCMTQQIVLSSTASEPVKEEKQNFYLWGMLPENNATYASQVCGGRSVAKVETRHTTSDIILMLVTIGIYQPRTVFVYCK